jgi:hypothetical protein
MKLRLPHIFKSFHGEFLILLSELSSLFEEKYRRCAETI